MPFIASAMWTGKPNTGNRVTNDSVPGVAIVAGPSDKERVLRVESIRAAPAAPCRPDWLGKRPPVPGRLGQDVRRRVRRPGHRPGEMERLRPELLGQQSHWSKNNVIVGGGVARLRSRSAASTRQADPQERRAQAGSRIGLRHRLPGHLRQVDAAVRVLRGADEAADGARPVAGVLDDARSWRAVGAQWKRQDTGNGGMELDIMEHLTRWGPCRYNIAMHWDGYGKEHKSIGSDRIYVQADKDGFITAGVLWTPGSTAYYCNGQEVCGGKTRGFRPCRRS